MRREREEKESPLHGEDGKRLGTGVGKETLKGSILGRGRVAWRLEWNLGGQGDGRNRAMTQALLRRSSRGSGSRTPPTNGLLRLLGRLRRRRRRARGRYRVGAQGSHTEFARVPWTDVG